MKQVVRWSAVSVGLMAAAVLVHQSCTGDLQIGDPSVEVAKIRFVPDELGGLQVADCLDRLGKDRCPVLPNDWDCKGLDVSVRGDGSLVGTCTVEENGRATRRTVRSAMPIACRMHQELGCVQCVDSFDRPVLDTCSDRTSLYTGQFGGLPNGSAMVTPPNTDQTGGGTGAGAGGSGSGGTGSTDGCNPDDASKMFEEKLNAILASEGFNFTFVSPRQDSPFNNGKSFNYNHQICTKDKKLDRLIKYGCDSKAEKEGFCYCWSGNRPTCRTARIVAKAVSDACSAVPADCDKVWQTRLWADHSAATSWLMKGSYAGSGWYDQGSGGGGSGDTGGTGGGDTGGTGSGGSGGSGDTGGSGSGGGGGGGDAGGSGQAVPRPGFNDVKNPKGITSKGSPLVLDLNGDGLDLTAAGTGVKFDLLGGGPVQTAWIRGADDALLALDRDSNGRIDSGGELFGEATNLGGFFAADGFQALAALDTQRFGGNQNGMVEQGDLMFDQLVLWTDDNRDGVSQPSELKKLSEAGVQALGLSASEQDVTDTHGNQLRLRSTFIRADGGSGPLVDVFFVNR